MFLLATKVVQFLIIGGVLLLFISTFIMNNRTKAPEGVELPEKCHSCLSTACAVKSDVEKVKEEMREAINKCEDQNETK